MTAKKTPEEYGKLAYEQYRAAVGGHSAVSGEPLPTWEENLVQRPEVTRAWICSAAAVFAATTADLLEHVKKAPSRAEHVDALAVRILQEHLLVGPRTGQCSCGWGDETLPVRYLGEPHGNHVARMLRAAGVLKEPNEARVLQEHLLVGPRPGQCLCGWGDESMPVRFLGRPHGEHVVEMLREAGALKEGLPVVASEEEKTDEATPPA